MRKRNQLQSQASKTGSEEAWCSYRNMRNKVTGNLQQAKRANFESVASKSNCRSGKGMWKELNRLLGQGNGSWHAFDSPRSIAN